MTKLNGKLVCNNEIRGLIRITRIEKACIKLNGWKREIWKWQNRRNSSPSPKQMCMYETKEVGYGFYLVGSLPIYLDQEEE
jgi:hypothetical protein